MVTCPLLSPGTVFHHSGEVLHAKKMQLYSRSSCSPTSRPDRMLCTGDGIVGSPLLAMFKRCSQENTGDETDAVHEDGGDKRESLLPIDDSLFTLARQPSRRRVAAASPPTSRGVSPAVGRDGKGNAFGGARQAFGNAPRSSCNEAKERDTRGFPLQAPSMSAMSVEGGTDRQGEMMARRGSGESGARKPSAAEGSVVDISLSNSDDDEDMSTVPDPAPSGARASGVTGDRPECSADGTRARVRSCGAETGEEGGRAQLDGRVVRPLVSATFFRSFSHGGGGDSSSGALDWTGRPCPTWLQEELASGAVKASGEQGERRCGNSISAPSGS